MRKGKGVFIATYFSFHDALIQAYTLPYVRMIRKNIPKEYPVYLFTVEKTTKDGNSVSELDRMNLSGEGIELISVRYRTFSIGILSWLPVLWKCLRKIKTEGVGAIHAWCTPGGAIGYILSVLSGKPLILDSFEPHAEVMTETGTWKKGSLKFKTLFLFEKLMAKRAIIHICCTKDMAEYSRKKYGVEMMNQFVKPACVDLEKFNPSHRKNIRLLDETGLEGKIVAVYAGKFGGLYLKKESFDFFRSAYEFWGDRFRVILLSSEPQDMVRKMSEESGLPEGIIVQRFVPHAEVPTWMGLGDFGFAPYQPVASRKHGAPIKVSEYLAMGLPVVITKDIADDSMIIENNKIGAVIPSLNEQGYLSAIRELDNLLNNPNICLETRRVAERLRNFDVAKAIYQEIYGTGLQVNVVAKKT